MADRRDEIEGTRWTWPSLIRRLRQRKLVQWTLAYAAAAFAVLQLIDLLGNRFAWPDAVVRSVIVLIGAGLLLTIVLAWYHGERGRQRVEGGELLMIAGVCALALAGVGTQIARSDAGADSVGGAPGTGSGDGSVAGARGEATADNGVFAVPTASNSIAVLPFANVGEDPDLDYFSDGLTDELTGALSKVPGLKVAARTSAFRFKGTNPDAREVGRALGVASVLDGSVRVVGDRLRVTATLVGTADGYHIWSERYDGDLVDIFAIQDEISLAIVDALRIQLRPVLAPATAPPSLEAYELYLRGRYFANRRSEESLVGAAAYFERAIASAPDYAPPYAGLADTYIAPRRSTTATGLERAPRSSGRWLWIRIRSGRTSGIQRISAPSAESTTPWRRSAARTRWIRWPSPRSRMWGPITCGAASTTRHCPITVPRSSSTRGSAWRTAASAGRCWPSAGAMRRSSRCVTKAPTT
jgi:TolB-like protein